MVRRHRIEMAKQILIANLEEVEEELIRLRCDSIRFTLNTLQKSKKINMEERMMLEEFLCEECDYYG